MNFKRFFPQCVMFLAVCLTLGGIISTADISVQAQTQTTEQKTAYAVEPQVSPTPRVIEPVEPVPDPTPTPTPAPSPTPTPDPAGQDSGNNDPLVDDAELQDAAPVEDAEYNRRTNKTAPPPSTTDPVIQPIETNETPRETSEASASTSGGTATDESTGTNATTGSGGSTYSPPPGMSYGSTGPVAGPAPCARTIKAHVVALDQVFFWNRLGAVQPQGMIFSLRHNVVPKPWWWDMTSAELTGGLQAGNVRLRGNKRPRPIALRMNVGDCLQIEFENLLQSSPVDSQQPATRTASVHIAGLQLVNSIKDDGSNVGKNASSLVSPGQKITYTYYADREGSHLMYSAAATTGGEGDGGSIPAGLFGSVNVEPKGAEWYRSQITELDMWLATKKNAYGQRMYTSAGQPIIDYDAVYPKLHPYQGLPILKMVNKNNILVHSDLNAIITGPNRARFPAGTYPTGWFPQTADTVGNVGNPVEPQRDKPFREFTVIYHDEIGAVQAFPHFEDKNNLAQTLHSVRDAFAINYGAAGIGAEVLANRLKVGPMATCVDCLYEEFFLTSWAVGDPAMIVDVPANAPCTIDDIRGVEDGGPGCSPTPGFKATKAFYPDDPSNVHHSYIRDHVKFRVSHAGPKEHHIHHLHAHQWLHTPDSDNSTYLDSQALGPGSSFTTEIAYHGTGNRNQVVGDSIFHCHFYPHFAMGMWELWRSHDVFEAGTYLNWWDGRPASGARALPDAEIKTGTPIPALVPIPGQAMAPMPEVNVSIVNGQAVVPAGGNPGFPFFVAGVAGHRPPHPPFDTIDDGGLPRHVVTGGTAVQEQTPTSFHKEMITAVAEARPETGTPAEIAAMNYHDIRFHPSFTPEGNTLDLYGKAANFVTNGLPRRSTAAPGLPGAPFADPCIDDSGNAVGVQRIYKGAAIQLAITMNKAGWHYDQSRILTLWEDVAPTRAGTRPPEPLFFRANTNDCVVFHHTNLVPKEYKFDDFQVRTPTDIIGQHIHLVKFDVTASDGAGNGWNYEDGTFAPDEVTHRIEAINKTGGLKPYGGGTGVPLAPKAHPFFGTLGAQTTVQRWYVDDVLNNGRKDRTLRTVFSHDHFGPSTHQQTGLYAGLVTEPKGSTWKHNETGQVFGTRADGGPTSWQAVITTNPNTESYREFLLEFADFQHAYKPNGGVFPDPKNVVNPPGKVEDALPFLVKKPDVCENGNAPPCPEAISADDVGTMSVNYRNEPVALRIRNPATNTQAAGLAGNLSHVYRSNVPRADNDFNVKEYRSGYPDLTYDVKDGDPFTPLLRAYENDRVQIRIMVGAHEEGHNFTVHGIKWLFEPSDVNSGYRNSQMMGISEHYEFIVPEMPKNSIGTSDYMYQPGGAVDDQWNGLWGIFRTYNMTQGASAPLEKLPNNANGYGPTASNAGDYNGVCPKTAPPRNYDISAVMASTSLPNGRLEYNGQNGYTFSVTDPSTGTPRTGPLNDPTAILYVMTSDLDINNKLLSTAPIEPLILRANAGDCINVTLRNKLPDTVLPDLDGYNTLPMIVDEFNANHVRPSNHVGLRPQLVFYDVTRSNGTNIGFNPVQTAKPGGTTTYQWYAGDTKVDPVTSVATSTPIEFGAINLTSSDPIKHSNKGAIAALIIEPQGSTWTLDAGTRAKATISKTGMTSFREFVTIFQNDVNMRFGDGSPVPNLAEAEDAEDSGQKALNYRTEPLWVRKNFWPATKLEDTRTFNFTGVLRNSQIGMRDPVTPIFNANVGVPVRFRVLQPGGHARNNTFMVHGHSWQELPYVDSSRSIGSNPLSQKHGVQFGHGPSNHFDAVINRAGGAFSITGDYLYRTFQSFQFDAGIWGIFRVGTGTTGVAPAPDPIEQQPMQ